MESNDCICTVETCVRDFHYLICASCGKIIEEDLLVCVSLVPATAITTSCDDTEDVIDQDEEKDLVEYTKEERMQMAMDFYQEYRSCKDVSLRKVALLFNVKTSTFHDRLNGSTAKKGRRTLLSKSEESELTLWIDQMVKNNWTISKSDIVKKVHKILQFCCLRLYRHNFLILNYQEVIRGSKDTKKETI